MHWLSDELAVSGLHDFDFGVPVGAVLNVCETRPYRRPDVAYLHRGFPDVQPFPLEAVWECVQWLDRQIAAGRKALVHCAEGNSRSVTVVVAYLLYKGHRLDRIKAKILRRKPFAQLGGRRTSEPQYFQDGFLRQWRRFLSEKRRPA